MHNVAIQINKLHLHVFFSIELCTWICFLLFVNHLQLDGFRMHTLSPMMRPPAPVYPPSLENKICEINRRLRERPGVVESWWWDNFVLEFFDDAATMLISFYCPTEGEKHFSKINICIYVYNVSF